jgi:hypothetical protein
MPPISAIKTFHYLGFINRLENGCQDKSTLLIVIDEPRSEIKQSLNVSEAGLQNRFSSGIFPEGRGCGFHQMVVFTRLHIQDVLNDSARPPDIHIDRLRT